MGRLNELLSGLNILEVRGAENFDTLQIAGVSYHSGKTKKDDIFVCIKGYKTDGHSYIDLAIKNGAVAVIVEVINPEVEIPQILVEDSRKALAIISSNFYNNPSKKMKIIGITATNGKTTTAYMTNHIFETFGLSTGIIGTVSVKYKDKEIPSYLTTPESLDLQGYLRDMHDENIDVVTMEVSSSALDLKRVYGVDFDIVTFNNISREHIDLHGSFEEYFKAKSSLITNAKEGSWAILNLDCPYSSSLQEKTKANVLTFSVEKDEGHFCCKNLDLSSGRGKFVLDIRKPFTVGDYTYEKSEYEVSLSVPGYHSVYNAMVAIGVGLLSGIPIETIKESFTTFVGVERRFEFIYEKDFKIIDDHFANSGNIDVTLETLDYMDYKNLELVYAIRGSRGPIVNKENAESIVKWSKKLGLNHIIATKSISHTTEKDKVLDEEVQVFKEVLDNAGLSYTIYDELDEAIDNSLSNAGEGDVILLAGCQGMDYGANLALNLLHEKNPKLDKDELFLPLKDRVCGMD